jgi:hypothetical protein
MQADNDALMPAGGRMDDRQAMEIEISSDNIRAAQVAYFAAMMEELKLFQVADKLVEAFQNGRLPLGHSRTGKKLFKYWQDGPRRIPAVARRKFYASALGIPGGDAGNGSNREFPDLFLRFVIAVVSFARQATVSDLATRASRLGSSWEAVHRAASELAVNLSRLGSGWTYFMATQLQTETNDVIKLLSEPGIISAIGARDMWEVVDEVAARELGGARNSIRYRTMAASGTTIIGWLAKNARALSSNKLSHRLNPDAELFQACEQWLAVAGEMEERQQPSDPKQSLPSEA